MKNACNSLILVPVVLGLTLSNAAGVAQPELRERVRLAWTAQLTHRSAGYGVVLGGLGAPVDWVEPNLADALGIGIDTRNPKTEDWFNADGNIYGRPEREISLHWRGREIANRRAPVDLQGDVAISVNLRAVTGGSELTLRAGGALVYDRTFVPDLRPVATAPRTGGDARIGPVTWRASGRRVARETPVRVAAFRRELNNSSRHEWRAPANFTGIPGSVGRVVATLRLDPTPEGLDKWDRIGQIWVVNPQGERFELLRYMTPYRRAWEWRVDVTDCLPLFQGQPNFEGRCETYGEGWLVSLDLDFYPGQIRPTPFAIQNLWNGSPVIGQASAPLTDFFRPLPITAPAGTRRTVVRTLVTGHGMEPNAKNAAEFLPLWREIRVNDTVWRDSLWKADNDLNPCRPQGGTWKFDRAGWGPGDVVSPWSVDITRALVRGAGTLNYAVEPYENFTPAPGNPARHIVGSQVIFYR